MESLTFLMVISRPCKGYVSGNFGMIMVYMFCKVDLLGLEVSYRAELLCKVSFQGHLGTIVAYI